MQPYLGVVEKGASTGQAAQFIPVGGTNGKGPYRFNSTGNFWTFQWNLNGATPGTYEGTTFDSSGVQSFTVTFSLKKSCPSSVRKQMSTPRITKPGRNWPGP